MIRFIVMTMLLLASGAASAQSICQSGSADERFKCIVGDLMGQNIGLATQVQQLRAALKDAQDQVKACGEPKPSENK